VFIQKLQITYAQEVSRRLELDLYARFEGVVAGTERRVGGRFTRFAHNYRSDETCCQIGSLIRLVHVSNSYPN